MTYEYLELHLRYRSDLPHPADQLVRLSEEGWELVQILETGPDFWRTVLKRQKTHLDSLEDERNL